MRILILEQENTIRKSLSNLMERYKNFEVFSTHSFKEANSLFQTVPFDMVLCGDRLADGNGLEMLREWMDKNPKLISILMTVRGDDSLRQEAMKAGIRGYLEKPFDLEQLEEIIILSNPPLAKRGEGGFHERR
jgi:DNA-binding NtrC family response regulator